MKLENSIKPKNMVYINEFKRELLFNDIYKNFHFYIISMGTHPCAYVEIPDKYLKEFEKKDLTLSEELLVHGGISYKENYLHLSGGTTMRGNLFIGWDYAHAGDYMALPSCIRDRFDDSIFGNTKIWTTEEIIEHCKDVIDQLYKIGGLE